MKRKPSDSAADDHYPPPAITSRRRVRRRIRTRSSTPPPPLPVSLRSSLPPSSLVYELTGSRSTDDATMVTPTRARVKEPSPAATTTASRRSASPCIRSRLSLPAPSGYLLPSHQVYTTQPTSGDVLSSSSSEMYRSSGDVLSSSSPYIARAQTTAFVLTAAVAKGGFGTIWQARNTLDARHMVAVKRITIANERERTRAHAEFLISADICNDHVLSAFAYGSTRRSSYLVMEYAPCGDLLALMMEAPHSSSSLMGPAWWTLVQRTSGPLASPS
ncbi:hypothetical protein AURDEDRAFT_120434 [Auricularia subglabra TFB-10046 SS5]|nr:hypothetical protein AURDEDRAFT_120434 [Auricularia subglabra TFB-10046 SS5]